MNDSVFDNNMKLLEFWSDYLNENPRYITKEMVEEIAEEVNLDKDLIVKIILKEMTEDPEDKDFYYEFLMPSVNKLKEEDYLSNEYLKNVRPKEGTLNNISIKYLT